MIDIDDVRRLRAVLSASSPGADATSLIEALGALEDLKNAAAAAQGVLAAALHELREAEDADRGVPARRRARGVAAEVALARRESLHRGSQHVALARTLHEMPHTHAAFRAGRISEWRAQLLLRETACLSRDDRETVDGRLSGDTETLAGMGDGETVAAASREAYQLDPYSVVERRARAERERRVTVRPAPDVMSHLSALLPVKDGVAVYACLRAAADAAIAAGDERGRGQLMADTLVARVTRTASGAPLVSVSIDVVVPDTVLTHGSDEAAHVDSYGPIPADLAREMTASADWLRRLYATPATGALVAMDSVRRLFPDGLKRFLRLRDRTCRVPWCDAPIRQADHIEPAEAGGPTSAINGEGACAAHNLAKEAHGWSARPRPGPLHTVEIVTPTGHRYLSQAPPVRRREPATYPVDLWWAPAA